MKPRVFAAVALGVILTPSCLEAQMFWEAPLMVAPNSPAGVSMVLAEMDPYSGLAGIVAWRGQMAPGSWGFRGGLGEGIGGELAGFGGVDFSGWIMRSNQDMPLDIAWVTGFGLGAGNYVLMSAPLGASFAYEVAGPDVWFNPYITPYLILDAALGDARPTDRDGLDLGIAVDVGADLAFSAGWALRLAASLGDRRALAIGVHLPGVGPSGGS